MSTRRLLPVYCLLVAVVTVVMTSCKDDDVNAEPVEIIRLDKVMLGYSDYDSAGRAKVRSQYAPAIRSLCRVLEMDSCGDADLLMWNGSLPVQLFTPEILNVFPNTDSIAQVLGRIRFRVDKNNLKVPRYQYVATAWGRPQSIVFDDTIALVALNHYLGADNRVYDHWPQYIRALKRPDMLPYDIIEAELGTAYPYTPGKDGGTVLNRMLYEGAMAYVKMQLVPDATLENALGFSREQLADIRDNSQFVWNRLVSDKLLYSTDAAVIEGLFRPMPSCNLISPNAPGRVVRYTGYRMVSEYMDKMPDTELSYLLSPSFYSSTETLRKAAYNGD